MADSIPMRWFHRYRALEAEGLSFAECMRILNEEFPEQSRVSRPENQAIGPHAEQPDGES